MEYRQRTRHEMIEAQAELGTLDINTLGHGLFRNNEKSCLGEKTRGCYEILKMAKLAIDSIVIA